MFVQGFAAAKLRLKMRRFRRRTRLSGGADKRQVDINRLLLELIGSFRISLRKVEMDVAHPSVERSPRGTCLLG